MEWEIAEGDIRNGTIIRYKMMMKPSKRMNK